MKKLIISLILPFLLYSQEQLYLNELFPEGDQRFFSRNSDLDFDGRIDLFNAKPYYENGEYRGKKLYFYGNADNLDGEPDLIFYEYEENDIFPSFGHKYVSGDDINGDGYDDLVVSASGCHNHGWVYIYFGSDEMDTEVDMVLRGFEYTHGHGYFSMLFGGNIDISGDYNGDGYNDLLIISKGENMFDEGFLYIFDGGPNFDNVDDTYIVGEIGEMLGNNISTGDLNGDGFYDIVAQGMLYDQSNVMKIFKGSESGIINDPIVVENEHGLYLFNCDGDFNGDGKNELIYKETSYLVKIIFFDDDFSISDEKEVSYNINGTDVRFSYKSVVDFDGDGLDDLIVGTHEYYQCPARVYLSPLDFSKPPQYEYVNSDPDKLIGGPFTNLGDILDLGYDQIKCELFLEEDVWSRSNLFVNKPEHTSLNETIHTMELKVSNYPEPFNPKTTIMFDSREFEMFKLDVYNLKGETVYSKLYNSNNTQRETLEFNGSNLSSGTYLYTITLEDPIKKWNKVYRDKMVLVK